MTTGGVLPLLPLHSCISTHAETFIPRAHLESRPPCRLIVTKVDPSGNSNTEIQGPAEPSRDARGESPREAEGCLKRRRDGSTQRLKSMSIIYKSEHTRMTWWRLQQACKHPSRKHQCQGEECRCIASWVTSTATARALREACR